MLKFVLSIRVNFCGHGVVRQIEEAAFLLTKACCQWSLLLELLFYMKGCVNGVCALGTCCVFSKAQYSNPSNQQNPCNDLILFGTKLRYNKKRWWGTCLSLYMFRSLVIMKSPSRQFVFQLYLKTSSWRLRSQWGIYRRISSIRS